MLVATLLTVLEAQRFSNWFCITILTRTDVTYFCGVISSTSTAINDVIAWRGLH